MLQRKYLFPNVIELNYQAAQLLGVNVYLIDGGSEFILIDIGTEDTVEEIVELIRQMDFKLSKCKMIVATHADADHIQGLQRARELLKAPIAAHPASVGPLETADEIQTYASIAAQNIHLPLRPTKIDMLLNEGDVIKVGKLKLNVWHTPGHTPGQLSFKMGNLLLSGDNIYKDSCVGVIDAHHGSDLPKFIESLKRILADDSEFLLPSHGPVFRRDPQIIQKAIDRLTAYQFMPDFGTCAIAWPLLDEFASDLVTGRMPNL
ncbi:MBL fold metallo-hydrolase [Tuwongella immobilis]|uniref:Metallo-beta-lactamase domain-containing protein n=1 Tax=Tuwongella immobilis TaxID=692036 RepID=A0A6C2YSN8_9BACT|nr:MBL fold metallo-hydrolase [Tuwongella immobilis]VIP03892.1 beta-lactamase domain protein : Zn-dependent hydrolase, glyoxylase OS=Singulisphaera acidiphila (strain ATCC BAA-1392 / DSM 18658 / VKM B-2454 / MOB10) GN=Sinac_6178 PE=4 SV=1: Lactamase_B [Tuwongella immobilis]VTS05151.1 beta-lactamase domain protein : Zn-dependent hydrolase, glyoxylase OS=Singulisphaera acidiphila (strain ATCC BAA-1392 / DSM 18658 / VKM B-2454 / MOB10) GN=Sinac_6178 PE=4 SV=1: Lactamase_B [Tuwongella immobilis]